MRGEEYFKHPEHEWQRRYEALRSSFVDRLPDRVIADRFGFSCGYFRVLKHQFRHGKIDFSEPVPEGKISRRKISNEIRRKIISWRTQLLSAGEITELLSEEGIELSVRTIERVIAEEGLPKLPRRTRKKIGLTVKGAEIPARSELVNITELEGKKFHSSGAGIFLFAPFITYLDGCGSFRTTCTKV